MPFSIKAALVLAGLLLVTTVRGADDPRIGTRATEWKMTDWLNSKPLTLKSLRGQVVLVRWWTGGGCPFCAATAPALKEYHARYAARGLVVVGVYHHKGRGPLQIKDVKQSVNQFGFRFPVAVDPEWQTLKRWWLNDAAHQWTSVSFLIDRKGIIRHVHPGGKYVKGDKAYQAMKSKIDELLKEQ